MRMTNAGGRDQLETKIRRAAHHNFWTIEQNIVARAIQRSLRSGGNKKDYHQSWPCLAEPRTTWSLCHRGLKRDIEALWIPFAALILSGCATIDGGSSAQQQLKFDWQQEGERSGSVHTVTKDGQIFHGRFYEITRKTRLSEIRDLRFFWGIRAGKGNLPGWGSWENGIEIMTAYTGKVLAILRGRNSKMRCRFTPIDPSLGISGGGNGWCQRSSGGGVPAMLPPKS